LNRPVQVTHLLFLESLANSSSGTSRNGFSDCVGSITADHLKGPFQHIVPCALVEPAYLEPGIVAAMRIVGRCSTRKLKH